MARCVAGVDGSGGEDGSLRAASGLAQMAPVVPIVGLRDLAESNSIMNRDES
jgi:hypothetical protein